MSRITYRNRRPRERAPGRKKISYEAPQNCVSRISSSSSAPCGRYGHRTVCFENKMVLYGGYNGEKRFNDTYEYDIESKCWKKISTKGLKPGHRDCHSAALYRSKMIIFGGGNGEEWLNDLLSYDIQTKTWKTLPQRGAIPSKRAGHSAVIYEDKMYIFGGWDGRSTLNDLYEYEFKSGIWKNVKTTGNKPRRRDSHQSVVCGDQMLIIGGGDGSLRLSDMFILDFTSKIWSEIQYLGDGKVGRAGHVVKYYFKLNKLLMFGGGNGKKWINNIFEFDLKSQRWVELDIETKGVDIPASYGASGVLYRNRMIIFGGGDGLNWYDGIYEYQIEKEFKSRTDNKLFDVLKSGKLVDVSFRFMDDEDDDDDDRMDCSDD